MPLFYVFAKSEMIISCSDITLSRYSSVAISFVHRTISRQAAHVAVSFVSRYSSVSVVRDSQKLTSTWEFWKLLAMQVTSRVSSFYYQC